MSDADLKQLLESDLKSVCKKTEFFEFECLEVQDDKITHLCKKNGEKLKLLEPVSIAAGVTLTAMIKAVEAQEQETMQFEQHTAITDMYLDRTFDAVLTADEYHHTKITEEAITSGDW